jgi:hypothetical protein
MMRFNGFARTALAVCVAISAASAEANVFEKATHGKPAVKSIHVLGFGPEGTLLIGDGAGAQIFAVATNDPPSSAVPAKVEGIAEKLAARLGAKADGIEILDLAVHPTSNVVYFAVRKQDDKTPLVFTLRPDGAIGLFELESVDYARIALGSAGGPAVSRITDVAWVDDKLLAAAGANEEFASKIFFCRTPLKHDAVGELHSAETYHVAHHKWETKAPMSVILPYKEQDKTYVVGAFACTPVVKYSLDDLTQPDAKAKGISVIELGSGNRPLDMFTYEKDGKEYVLTNTFRFHHAKTPFGPSPYWTVRFERNLLGENENVNEKAMWRLQGQKPATDRIQMIDAYHGVTQMDRLGSDRAVVLRQADGGRLDLDVLPLP